MMRLSLIGDKHR